MQDFSLARRMMVDNQLRPLGVTDRGVLAAMGRVERERFVPETARALAYFDRSIRLGDAELTKLPPHEVPKAGVAYVPQGRRLFAEMTVAENIEIGLMARGKGASVRNAVLDLFPILRERLKQRSGTLSGGEQQMLAMARALCLEPKVLLLDEPTEGLMPSMIAKIRETVAKLREQGVSTILVEQRVDAVLPVADRVSFIENGRVRETVDVGRLREEPELVKRYVGVS